MPDHHGGPVAARLAPMPEVAALPDDPTNAWDTDPAAAALGQKLFFDKCYSEESVACADCHAPSQGFQWQDDGQGIVTSPKTDGLPTPNHAQTLINAAVGNGSFPNWQFWDGRRDNQWAQALFPPENPKLMASSRGLVAATIRDHYLLEYETTFGDFPDIIREECAPERCAWEHIDARPNADSDVWSNIDPETQDAITEVFVNFGKAIAAYERNIVSRDSRFDHFLADIHAGADDSDALSLSEKRGLRVFMGVGGCIECHRGINLTDGAFHNLGVADGKTHDAGDIDGRARGKGTYLDAEPYSCEGRWSDADPADCPNMFLDVVSDDDHAVKTPTLRDISNTAPYMHTGTLETLEQVVDFYDRGGDPSGFGGLRDQRIAPLNLSPQDKADLVAFLHSLDGAPMAHHLMVVPDGVCGNPSTP